MKKQKIDFTRALIMSLVFAAPILPIVTGGELNPVPIATATAAGGGEEEKLNAPSHPISELLKFECEHKIRQVDCDECRYELGAVKLPASATTLVRVETLGLVREARAIEVTGTLAFDEKRVQCLPARFSAYVASVTVAIGDRVKPGQRLFVLVIPELAQAALDLRRREAETDLAEKRLAREKSLLEKKIGAAQEYQEALSGSELARLDWQNARRRLALFGLGETQIQDVGAGKGQEAILKGELIVPSPTAGRVVSRDAQIGDMVEGHREIIKVADLSHLWGLAHLPEKNLSEIIDLVDKKGLVAEVSVDAAPGRIFPARGEAIYPGMEKETQTVLIRLAVENHNEILRAGMFFRAKLFLGRQEELPALPLEAVLEDEGRAFVFIRHGESMYFRRDVTLGQRVGNRVTIFSGIRAGDAVVIQGAFLMKSDILREKMGAGCAD